MKQKSNHSSARRQRAQTRKRRARNARARTTRIQRQEQRRAQKAARDISQRAFAKVLESEEVRKLVGELMPEYRDRVFPPLTTLAMFLKQVLSADRSCINALEEAVASGLVPDDASESTGPYCDARARLPVELIQRLCQLFAQEMSRLAPEAWKWRDREVKAVDGTTVLMEDTEPNRMQYPQHGNQKTGAGFPIARLVAVISITTGAVTGVAMGAYKGKCTGEHALFRELHQCFSKGDVMVADAYYCSYFLIAALLAMGVDFVFERHGARKTNFNRGVKLGTRDHLVKWERPRRPDWMTEEEYAACPEELTVREVKVRGKILVTSFVKPRKVPKKEVGTLFEQRWHIEVDLRNIKTTLGMEKLSCKSPEMCAKEIRVYMLAYNTIRLLMAEAALMAGLRPRQLSFSHTVKVWLAWAYRGRRLSERRMNIIFRRISRVRVGNRPGRIEPRAVKQRPKTMPRLTTTRAVARRRIRRHGHPKKLVA